jgi:hypothetical protein
VKGLNRNKPALVLGGTAAALLVLVVILLLDDNGDNPAPQRAPATQTVRKRPPTPIRTGGERKDATHMAVASSEGSFYVEGAMEGSTLQWNGQAGNYLPTEGFKRPTTLVIDPDNNFGLFSGSIVDDSAGRLWFATNSYVFRHMNSVGPQFYLSRLQVAEVTATENTLEAVVGPGARTVQLNSFQVKSGLSSPKQITEGRVEMTASEQGVRGEIELYGGGYIEPGNSFPVDLIRATFSGG